MLENDPHGGDRRLQSLVHELDKKVHSLETVSETNKIEVAYLKGEVSGLRASTATSSEVAAGTALVNERIENLRRDVAGMKSVFFWFLGAVGLGLVAAGLRLILKDGGGL